MHLEVVCLGFPQPTREACCGMVGDAGMLGCEMELELTGLMLGKDEVSEPWDKQALESIPHMSCWRGRALDHLESTHACSVPYLTHTAIPQISGFCGAHHCL